MAVTLSEAIEKLNDVIDDNISGTTDSDGDEDGTTLIDSELARYGDSYFGDPDRKPEWFVYIHVDSEADVGELRTVKQSTADGLIVVYKAFSDQIASATSYELHRFDRDKKIKAWNRALSDCYPSFYKKIEDDSLTGTGGSATEYEVPTTFPDFPDEVWQRNTSDDKITLTRIKGFKVVEIEGTMYFYANITEDDDIVLIGREPLTAFDSTDDESETELTSTQADTVALLAASNLYRMLSSVVAADMSERYDSLANRYEQMYEVKKFRTAMPIRVPRVVQEWA